MIENCRTLVLNPHLYLGLDAGIRYGWPKFDFSFNVHRLLVKDLDPLPVDHMAGFKLVFPDCGLLQNSELKNRIKIL